MSQSDLIPSATPLTEPFWDAAMDHRLVMQRCLGCKKFQWLPVPRCKSCGGELVWVDISGGGTIYTYTVVRQVVRNMAFRDRIPYVLGMVELDEGPRMIAPIDTKDFDRVRIGTRVRVVFEDITGGFPLPRFRLEQQGRTQAQS